MYFEKFWNRLFIEFDWFTIALKRQVGLPGFTRRWLNLPEKSLKRSFL